MPLVQVFMFHVDGWFLLVFVIHLDLELSPVVQYYRCVQQVCLTGKFHVDGWFLSVFVIRLDLESVVQVWLNKVYAYSRDLMLILVSQSMVFKCQLAVVATCTFKTYIALL